MATHPNCRCIVDPRFLMDEGEYLKLASAKLWRFDGGEIRDDGTGLVHFPIKSDTGLSINCADKTSALTLAALLNSHKLGNA